MRWTVELSEEVRAWVDGLTPTGKATTKRMIERLATQGHLLRMPHSKPLGDGLHELRFTCEDVARRITYVLDPERRAVTLTTFRKQRQNERTEILRARRAQANHAAARAAAEEPKDSKATTPKRRKR
jgi:hypothetical protein